MFLYVCVKGVAGWGGRGSNTIEEKRHTNHPSSPWFTLWFTLWFILPVHPLVHPTVESQPVSVAPSRPSVLKATDVKCHCGMDSACCAPASIPLTPTLPSPWTCQVRHRQNPPVCRPVGGLRSSPSLAFTRESGQQTMEQET